MVVWDRENGNVYSDASTYEQWKYEIESAKSAWYESTMAEHVPAWVVRKAHSKKQSDLAQVQSFLRTDGFLWHADESSGKYFITHKGRIISRFIIFFQRPSLGRCRICGGPLSPNAMTGADTHPGCDFTTHLQGMVFKEKRSRGADLPDQSNNGKLPSPLPEPSTTTEPPPVKPENN